MALMGDQLKPIDPSEGWQAIMTPGTRVFHYIRKQMSLCRRIGFYSSNLVPHIAGNPKGHEDCAECFRKINGETAARKRKAKSAAE